MARKPTETPETPTEVDMPGLPAAAEAANQLAVLHEQQEANAKQVALSIGYEGTLTIGALEDEIRFFQRRTVEALLEVGKRLLVLKELTPHGEFESRVEMLGFKYRSAARFMQAAAKTAKSANLAVLATQVKNTSAFLELITHDEDTLKELREIDDTDRMSASQLRETVRSLRGDLKAKDDVLDEAQKKLTRLQVQLNQKIVADTDWPDALQPLAGQICAAGKKVAQAISELETCRLTLFEEAQNVPEDGRAKYEAAMGYISEVYNTALISAEEQVARERSLYEKTLADYAPEYADEAAQQG